MTQNTFIRPLIIVASIFSLFLILSCGEQPCKTTANCKAGKICKRGICIDNSSNDNLDTFPFYYPDSDDLSSDGYRDSESTGDSSDLTDDTESASDTVCQTTQENGESCEADCACYSNHCSNGICCREGECCLTAADCENDLCANVGCRGDNYCVYGTSAYPCGARDEEGASTCTGLNVCNGFGECLPVDADCGTFTEDLTGAYTCAEGRAVAPCYTDCTAENQSLNCAVGAVCLNEKCVAAADAANGSPCNSSTECASQHCDHGICCSVSTSDTSGTCCETVDDCSDECRTASCADFSCNITAYAACGALDTAGAQTCDGENRCDGSGGCFTVTEACGNYAGDNTYGCVAGESVSENCFAPCTYSFHCADGFSCDAASGECIFGSSLEDGEVCTEDSQCISRHCQNGFCCVNGECCASATDCVKDLCGEATCVDYQCTVGSYYSCGAEDTTGNDGCADNARCDGAGGCFTLTACEGPYRTIPGQFDCVLGEGVSETCRISCGNDNECNPGYECDAESKRCIEMAYAQNGEACEMDADCKSEFCHNGTCCAAGECCKVADDCRIGRCVYEVCTSSGLCNSTEMVPCGLPDTMGAYSNCSGGALCDGMGECDTSVARCSGAYAWNGDYICSTENVTEACFESCTTDQECNPGYGCMAGQCVEKKENGEGPCYSNAECVSNNCNKETAVCCEYGMCCIDSSDCGGGTCDPLSSACDISCDGGSGDDDAICTLLGDYHCDDGKCVSNLMDGEYICDEASDCRSGYCDADTLGICCADDAATCCVSSYQCDGGFACIGSQCVDDCSPSGTPVHDLCASQYHCEGDACVADISNGTVGCVTDVECSDKSKCVNSICCSDEKGDCCRSDATCNDGNPCTDDICLPSYHCSNLPSGAGASCDTDGEFCTGTDICDDSGNCIKGAPPCQEDGLCRTGTCNEETDSCETGALDTSKVGSACSEALFCLNGRTKVCNASGECVDPDPAGGVPCATDSEDDCSRAICDEITDQCAIEQVIDGTLCHEGDACTGQNTCEDGVCVPGMDLPCEDGDPCTTDPCTVVDGQPVCGSHDPIVDAVCNDSFHCFGENPTCHDGQCVATENVCADDMGICTIDSCREQYYGKVDCEPPVWNDLTVFECGASVNLNGLKMFVTREYYQYSDDFCPGSYPGMEAAIAIVLPSDGSVTLTVSNVVPDMDINLLALGDWCNPNTCEHSAINSLTIDGVAGMNVVVLEAMAELPPMGFDLNLSSCP